MSYQYVYLIQTHKLANGKVPVYKIGKTKQINFEHPEGSVQIFQSLCYNCDVLEENIIKRFHAKYENCESIGTEYFKGNVRHMIDDICELLLLEPVDLIFEVVTPTTRIKSRKEQVIQVSDIKDAPSGFSCTNCGYYCLKNTDLLKHFATKKHLRNQMIDKGTGSHHCTTRD
jgi:hypothetical protein